MEPTQEITSLRNVLQGTLTLRKILTGDRDLLD